MSFDGAIKRALEAADRQVEARAAMLAEALMEAAGPDFSVERRGDGQVLLSGRGLTQRLVTDQDLRWMLTGARM